MNPTIAKVAEAAGVSAATVSRTFSRPHMISAATRERVQRAAQELGWRPNPMARALITGQTGNVGLVVPDIANPFFPPLIKAAQQVAWTQGFCLFLGHGEEDPEHERSMVGKLSDQVDGLLLVSSRLPTRALADVARKRRVVVVNRVVPGVPAVLIDSASGLSDAVDHLADQGHTKIGYVAGPTVSWSNEQRGRAIRRRAKARGLTLEVVGPIVPGFETGYGQVRSLLAAGVSAVMAYDDLTAMGILAGLSEAGVSVPEEMSVVGCDDVVPVVSRPALTTVSAPCAQAGRTAMSLLLDAGQPGEVDSLATVTLGGQLVVRETTGPAPPPRPVRR